MQASPPAAFSLAERATFPSPTRRIRLRLWAEGDRENFRRLNRNPRVMRFFPSPLSSKASDALLDRFMAHQAEEGFGVWPVDVFPEGHDETEGSPGNAPGEAPAEEQLGTPRFAGFAGLLNVRFAVPFPVYSSHPPVEIGWRFLPEFWGRGLACEAARASLAFGFHQLGLEEIVAFTAVANTPSRRLMIRLGMTRDPEDDFDHPSLPDDHPLLRHVLYRMAREEFHPG